MMKMLMMVINSPETNHCVELVGIKYHQRTEVYVSCGTLSLVPMRSLPVIVGGPRITIHRRRCGHRSVTVKTRSSRRHEPISKNHGRSTTVNTLLMSKRLHAISCFTAFTASDSAVLLPLTEISRYKTFVPSFRHKSNR